MIDPSVQVMTEADLRAPRLMPGGLCFICGTWIDHEHQQAYRVLLEDADGERQEFLAHAGCLSEVAHPSSALRKAIARPPEPPAEAGGTDPSPRRRRRQPLRRTRSIPSRSRPKGADGGRCSG